MASSGSGSSESFGSVDESTNVDPVLVGSVAMMDAELHVVYREELETIVDEVNHLIGVCEDLLRRIVSLSRLPGTGHPRVSMYGVVAGRY